jgi:hypothetical protein
MDQDNRLFVVLYPPRGVVTGATAFESLSSKDEFEGANERNTIWLENWKNHDVSPIDYLTIIRPPGNIELVTGFNELAEAFSSKVLEKLTYVWVTEMGEKFKSSRATNDTKYERVAQLSNMKFRSIRIEAFPHFGSRMDDSDVFGFLKLSKDTEEVELHDFHIPHLPFVISKEGSNLQKIEITGNTTFIKQVTFCGEGQTLIEARIYLKKLTLTKGGTSKVLEKSDMNWYDDKDQRSAGEMCLILEDIFPVNETSGSAEMPPDSHDHSSNHTSSLHHHHHGSSGGECNGSGECVLM